MLNFLNVDRGIAAVSVVIFHMLQFQMRPGFDFRVDYNRFLFMGIDFFFVLSGFIIFYAHREDLAPYGRKDVASEKLRTQG